MEKIKTFDELTIQDNFLFQHVMRNEQLCTHLIEKIVNIKVRSLHSICPRQMISIWKGSVQPDVSFPEASDFRLPTSDKTSAILSKFLYIFLIERYNSSERR